MGELRVSTAENIHDALESAVNPALNDLKQELEEESLSDGAKGEERPVERSTGDLRTHIEANKESEEYDVDKAPPTAEINRSLGLLDYHGVIEVEEENVWTKSSHRFNNFKPLTYNPERAEALVDYLSNRINEYTEDSNGASQLTEEDFNDFEEYVEKNNKG